MSGPTDNPTSTSTSQAVLAWVYVLALAVGTAVALAWGDWHPLGKLLVADLAATGVVFTASFLLNNTSVYDPYWSCAPLAIAAWWFAGDSGLPLREAIAFGLLGLWGARLTWNFLRGWPGLHHEDWRYVAYREWGPLLYWPISLFGLHLVPTLVVFAALLPVWGISEHAGPMGVVSWLGVGVCCVAIGLEGIADNQLLTFRERGPAPGAILDTGLWAWSRNPNYLGEIGFWWGMWLLAFGASWMTVWTAVGPMLVTALFVFISIPLKEGRMSERRGEAWDRYCERVPMLFPGGLRRLSGP